MNYHRIFSRFVLLFLLIITKSLLFSQWSTDPSVNTVVNIDEYMQTHPEVCTDMNGGAIVVWREKNSDIYAQRLDKFGNIMWDSDGVPICAEDMEQWPIEIISDGKGGAILLWQDYRELTDNISRDFASNTLYVQRINSEGRVLWNENGVQLSDFRIRTDYIINQQIMQTYCEEIISDAHGGAYICWALAHDSLMSQTHNLIAYIQHVDSTGNCLWEEYGKPLLTGISKELSIVSDDSSGVYCYISPDSVYRFGYDGNMIWDSALYLPTKWSSTLISDGYGGFYAIGIQNYPGKVIMYRVDRQGNKLLDNWSYEDEKGIEEDKLSVYSDGHNGFLLTCVNYEDTFHLLRVGPEGNILWENHGKSIDIPGIVDNFGNWFDLYGKKDSTYRVYAKKYDVDGNSLWGESGVIVRIRTEDWGWLSPWSSTSDQSGGLIMVWSETRHLTQYWDIMGQLINSNGQLGIVTNTIRSIDLEPDKINLIKCYPNPFNVSTTFAYYIAESGKFNISIFDINGKMVYQKEYYQNEPGDHHYCWFGQKNDNSLLSSGIYFVRASINDNSCIAKTLLLK